MSAGKKGREDGGVRTALHRSCKVGGAGDGTSTLVTYSLTHAQSLHSHTKLCRSAVIGDLQDFS